jgi:hypothetical protein
MPDNWVDPEVGAGWLLNTVQTHPDGDVAAQLRRDIEFADWWARLTPATRRRLRRESANTEAMVDDA